MTVTINGTTGLATDSTSAVVEAVSLNHPSSSTAAITMDASNNVTLASNLTMTGGIYLGGTGSANFLQDFETGSWTPVLAYVLGGTREYTATSANVGEYTKIGNTVYVTATVAWNGNNGGTTSSYVGVKGLPFSMTSTTDLRASGVMGGTVGLTMPSGYTSGFALGLDPSNSHVYVLARSTSGYSHLPTISASGALYGFSLVYLTDS